MKIIHLSDLHVSSSNYQPDWGRKVMEFVNSQSPDLLLITGDLTNEGHIHEYELWQDYFSGFRVPAHIIVPGNHDAKNGGWGIFQDVVGPRHPRWENDAVAIQGIDSSEPDLDDGNVGRENYHLISDLTTKGKVKIVMLHHHLIPIPGTGRERHIPTDAGDVLHAIKEAGVHLVLSGHKHRNWTWNLDGTYFITCGTSTSRRLKGYGHPSVMIYDIYKDNFVANELNVRDGDIQKKLDVILEL